MASTEALKQKAIELMVMLDNGAIPSSRLFYRYVQDSKAFMEALGGIYVPADGIKITHGDILPQVIIHAPHSEENATDSYRIELNANTADKDYTAFAREISRAEMQHHLTAFLAEGRSVYDEGMNYL